MRGITEKHGCERCSIGLVAPAPSLDGLITSQKTLPERPAPRAHLKLGRGAGFRMSDYDGDYLEALLRIAEALEGILKELKYQKPRKWVGVPK